MYGCESWTINKAECQRVDAFELWHWRGLLKVPWTTRRSNLKESQSKRKSVLNIHWRDWCWSWYSNALATWCTELTNWKRPCCWGRLRAGEGDDRGCNGWMVSPTRWTWVWVSSRSWWWTAKPGVLQSMGLQRVGPDWTEHQSLAHNRSSVIVTFSKERTSRTFRKLEGIKKNKPNQRNWKTSSGLDEARLDRRQYYQNTRIQIQPRVLTGWGSLGSELHIYWLLLLFSC